MLINFTLWLHVLYDLHRCCFDKQVSWFSRDLRTLGWENIDKLPCTVAAWKLRMGYPRLMRLHQSSMGKHPMAHGFWRRYSMPVSVEESSSPKSKNYSSNDDATESPESVLAQPLSRDEVKLHFLSIIPYLWWIRNINSFLISSILMNLDIDIEGIYLHFPYLCFYFLFLWEMQGAFFFVSYHLRSFHYLLSGSRNSWFRKLRHLIYF